MTSNVTAFPTETDTRSDDPRPALDPAGIDRAARSVANSTGLSLLAAPERNKAYGIAVQALAAYFATTSGT